MATLIIYKEGREEFRFPLRGKLLNLGRSSQCDLVLNDTGVSSLHANILEKKDGYFLVDLDSTNGTFLNGRQIRKSGLAHNDIIGMGKYQIKFLDQKIAAHTEVTAVEKDVFQEGRQILGDLKHAGADTSDEFTRSLERLDANYDEAQKRHEQLKVLFHLGEVINSTPDFDRVLEIILKEALTVTGMERGGILLFNDDEKLEPVYWAGLEKEELSRNRFSSTAINKAVTTGEAVVIADARADKDFTAAETIVVQDIRSLLCLPLSNRFQNLLGVLYADSRLDGGTEHAQEPDFLKMFTLFAATAIELRRAMRKEKALVEELTAAREKEKYEKRLTALEKENKRLVKKVGSASFDSFVGLSPVMQKLIAQCEKVAASDIPVLISGETGTGKSMLAGLIHAHSERREGKFMTIDCASIPSELLESELFGHEKGAFTGAITQKQGRIEMADKGTLFLDEIGDMPPNLQVKLLRFLQEKKFERLGGTGTITVDVRIITATHQDLNKAIEEKRFREDLYYRLCGVTLHIPPIRERAADAILLANVFLKDAAAQNNRAIKGFTPEARNLILHHPWEGNIRQLKHAVERAAILCEGEFVGPEDLGLKTESLPEVEHLTLNEAHEEVDQKLITYHLLNNQYHLSKTAEALGTDRGTLRRLMRKYDIKGKQRANGD